MMLKGRKPVAIDRVSARRGVVVGARSSEVAEQATGRLNNIMPTAMHAAYSLLMSFSFEKSAVSLAPLSHDILS